MVAAYEVARLLGLDNVPPAVLWRIDGQTGSLQAFVDEMIVTRAALLLVETARP